MATKTPEQIERDKARNAAIRNAKDRIRIFFADKIFGKLDPEVQDALKTLAPTKRQATNTIATEIANLFSEKSSLTELDVFKALKVGPNEMKAKVNHCLKVALPADRMWISYDSAECIWTMESVGEMPEGFDTSNLIPSLAAHLDNENFNTASFAQMIAAAKEQA